MKRIPIVGSLYGTSKQLVTLFEKKDPEKLQGMKAVFCFFGEKSGAGLLALLVSPERFAINGREFHIVIVPTAPVPVGGGLIFVPVEMVQPTNVSVEGLMSIYVSMGVSAGSSCRERRRANKSRPMRVFTLNNGQCAMSVSPAVCTDFARLFAIRRGRRMGLGRIRGLGGLLRLGVRDLPLLLCGEQVEYFAVELFPAGP